MDRNAKELIQNSLSVVTGVIIALAIIVPILYFAIYLVLNDERVPEWPVFSIMATGIIMGSFTGGYVYSKLSSARSFFPSTITATILIFLFLALNNFDLKYMSTE